MDYTSIDMAKGKNLYEKKYGLFQKQNVNQTFFY